MAIMTPNTFDPLLRYVNVRLQQGVPIVDADWNELDDVRKFELRAFLKWYVGDGVPDGNDGFRVAGGLDNDFTVTAGAPPPPAGAAPEEAALRHVGRIVVDGLDVIIEADLRFTEQPLHEDRPGAAQLAARLGVPVVARLATPGADGTFAAYLDVWERLVTPDDEPDLVHPGLGVETCARIRREWAVRVRPGAGVPQPGEADHVPGHIYYPLATLNRRAGAAAIAAADVTDRRERGLLVPPAHLLADTLGVSSPAYRRGEGRPLVSLREAVNALLAGRLPTLPDIAVSPGPGLDLLRRACVADAAGGLVAVWQSPRVASTNQVIASRLDLSRVDAGFSTAQQVSSGGQHIEPTAVALPGGEILVAYQNGLVGAAGTDVVMKRAQFAQLPAASEQPVAASAGVADQSPVAVVTGNTVVFFVHVATAGSNRWMYRRYQHTDNTFLDGGLLQVSAATTTSRDLHAAAAGGMVWVAFSDGSNLQLLRVNPATANPPDSLGTVPATGQLDPFVLAISATEAMVVYDDGTALRTVSFSGGSWGSPATVPGTDSSDGQPAAVRDAEGNVFLLSSRPVPDASNEIVLRRRNAVSGEWTAPQRIAPHAASEQRPFPVLVAGHGIWAFWMSDRPGPGNFDLFSKQIVTEI